MRVEVQLFDDLDAVAADAGDLLDRARQASLFDRLDWYQLTWRHTPPPGRLLVARARSDASAAWLFLTVDRGCARPLANWYTLRFAPVPGQPLPVDATGACLTAIARALRPHAHHIALSPLHDADLRALGIALAAAGWRVATHERPGNWSTLIAQGGWPAYWAARPGRLRETVRRRTRDGHLHIVVHDRFDPAAWAAYEAVYAASWKPAEGSFAFLRDLAEREGAAGALRLGIAHAGDRTVAAQLWLVERGIATIHKLAHVEDAKRGSPGTLLSAAMFRHAIEVDRVSRIDFGTGDEAYKADWMDTRAPLHRLDAWNPRTLRGLAGFARHRAAALVRRRVKV